MSEASERLRGWVAGDLSKAGAGVHKYIRRIRQGGRWRYWYMDPKTGRPYSSSKPPERHKRRPEAPAGGPVETPQAKWLPEWKGTRDAALKSLQTGKERHKPVSGKLTRDAVNTAVLNAKATLRAYSVNLPGDEVDSMHRFLDEQRQHLHDALEAGDLAKVDANAVNEMMIGAVHDLVYQTHESAGRQLGDHGIRHIHGNIEMGDRVFDALAAKGTKTSAFDRFKVGMLQAYHDIGYTAEPAREGFKFTERHKEYGLAVFDKHYSPRFKAVFGEKPVGDIRHMIATHDSADLDWKGDTQASVVRLSDNLALYAPEKLPALFRLVPSSIDVLEQIHASKGDQAKVLKLRTKLERKVDRSGISGPLRAQLKNAAREVGTITPKMTLGMLGGAVADVQFDGQSVNVTVEQSALDTRLQKMFDMGQRQFGKFAESYGLDDLAADKFDAGGPPPVLRARIVKDAAKAPPWRKALKKALEAYGRADSLIKAQSGQERSGHKYIRREKTAKGWKYWYKDPKTGKVYSSKDQPTSEHHVARAGEAALSTAKKLVKWLGMTFGGGSPEWIEQQKKMRAARGEEAEPAAGEEAVAKPKESAEAGEPPPDKPAASPQPPPSLSAAQTAWLRKKIAGVEGAEKMSGADLVAAAEKKGIHVPREEPGKPGKAKLFAKPKSKPDKGTEGAKPADVVEAAEKIGPAQAALDAARGTGKEAAAKKARDAAITELDRIKRASKTEGKTVDETAKKAMDGWDSSREALRKAGHKYVRREKTASGWKYYYQEAKRRIQGKPKPMEVHPVTQRYAPAGHPEEAVVEHIQARMRAHKMDRRGADTKQAERRARAARVTPEHRKVMEETATRWDKRGLKPEAAHLREEARLAREVHGARAAGPWNARSTALSAAFAKVPTGTGADRKLPGAVTDAARDAAKTVDRYFAARGSVGYTEAKASLAALGLAISVAARGRTDQTALSAAQTFHRSASQSLKQARKEAKRARRTKAAKALSGFSRPILADAALAEDDHVPFGSQLVMVEVIDELGKSLQHKYIKRVKVKGKYRYWYAIPGKAGLVHAEHAQVGSAFKTSDGHYHITGRDGDKVTVRHDETGKSETMTLEDLRAMIHGVHRENLDKRYQRIKTDRDASKKHGTTRQQALMQAALDQHIEHYGHGEEAAEDKPRKKGKPSEPGWERMPEAEELDATRNKIDQATRALRDATGKGDDKAVAKHKAALAELRTKRDDLQVKVEGKIKAKPGEKPEVEAEPVPKPKAAEPKQVKREAALALEKWETRTGADGKTEVHNPLDGKWIPADKAVKQLAQNIKQAKARAKHTGDVMTRLPSNKELAEADHLEKKVIPALKRWLTALQADIKTGGKPPAAKGRKTLESLRDLPAKAPKPKARPKPKAKPKPKVAATTKTRTKSADRLRRFAASAQGVLPGMPGAPREQAPGAKPVKPKVASKPLAKRVTYKGGEPERYDIRVARGSRTKIQVFDPVSHTWHTGRDMLERLQERAGMHLKHQRTETDKGYHKNAAAAAAGRAETLAAIQHLHGFSRSELDFDGPRGKGGEPATEAKRTHRHTVAEEFERLQERIHQERALGKDPYTDTWLEVAEYQLEINRKQMGNEGPEATADGIVLHPDDVAQIHSDLEGAEEDVEAQIKEWGGIDELDPEHPVLAHKDALADARRSMPAEDPDEADPDSYNIGFEHFTHATGGARMIGRNIADEMHKKYKSEEFQGQQEAAKAKAAAAEPKPEPKPSAKPEPKAKPEPEKAENVARYETVGKSKAKQFVAEAGKDVRIKLPPGLGARAHRFATEGQMKWWIKQSGPGGVFLRLAGGPHQGDEPLDVTVDLSPGVYTIGTGPYGEHGFRQDLKVSEPKPKAAKSRGVELRGAAKKPKTTAERLRDFAGEAGAKPEEPKTEPKPKPKAGAKATPKQIQYAGHLLGRLSRWDWAETDAGETGMSRPTTADLREWSGKEVSMLIDDMRESLGLPPSSYKKVDVSPGQRVVPQRKAQVEKPKLKTEAAKAEAKVAADKMEGHLDEADQHLLGDARKWKEIVEAHIGKPAPEHRGHTDAMIESQKLNLLWGNVKGRRLEPEEVQAAHKRSQALATGAPKVRAAALKHHRSTLAKVRDEARKQANNAMITGDMKAHSEHTAKAKKADEGLGKLPKVA